MRILTLTLLPLLLRFVPDFFCLVRRITDKSFRAITLECVARGRLGEPYIIQRERDPLNARFSASRFNFARIRIRILCAISRPLHLVISVCLSVRVHAHAVVVIFKISKRAARAAHRRADSDESCHLLSRVPLIRHVAVPGQELPDYQRAFARGKERGYRLPENSRARPDVMRRYSHLRQIPTLRGLQNVEHRLRVPRSPSRVARFSSSRVRD